MENRIVNPKREHTDFARKIEFGHAAEKRADGDNVGCHSVQAPAPHERAGRDRLAENLVSGGPAVACSLGTRVEGRTRETLDGGDKRQSASRGPAKGDPEPVCPKVETGSDYRRITALHPERDAPGPDAVRPNLRERDVGRRSERRCRLPE